MGGNNEKPIGRDIEKSGKPVVGYYQTPFDEAMLAVICIFVGMIAGLAAVAFRWLVHSFHFLFWNGGEQVFGFMGEYYKFVVPIIGMFSVGIFLHLSLRKEESHGVTEVIRAINLRNGKISHHIASVEGIASSLCIGIGGSAGPEGPMVQVGAGVGSSVGQFLRLPPAKLIQVTAAGAAGGLAAIFNAPIAGVIFAMEAVLSKFHMKGFCYLVLASVSATYVMRSILGNEPLLEMSDAVWGSWYELIIFVILGIAGGIISSSFIKMLRSTDHFFDRFRSIPPYAKPVLGGVILGTLALFLPQVLGEGYEYIDLALQPEYTIGMFAILLFFKLFATSVTFGSGGSGGFFAPALVFGAFLGGFFSLVCSNLFPGIVGSHETYIAVGIAAILASLFKAPITAIIMVVEITHNYDIVLPLMAASASATYVGDIFFKGVSIYDIDLVQEGIREVEADLWLPSRAIQGKELVGK